MKLAEKSNSILLDLKNRHQEDKVTNRNLMPDVNTYNQVLAAYARTRSVKGASQSQAILDVSSL